MKGRNFNGEKMLPACKNIWAKQFMWISSSILAGYFGGRLSALPDYSSSPDQLKCRELSIVDSNGKPLIKLSSEKAGPEIKLRSKDGVQELSLAVIDASNRGDDRMAKIDFRHSELEKNQISICAARDKSSFMFMGQPDSFGSIYMSTAPFGAKPASDFTVGYFSGPHIECFTNDHQAQLKIGHGTSFLHAGKIGDNLPYLRLEGKEKNGEIDLLEEQLKQRR